MDITQVAGEGQLYDMSRACPDCGSHEGRLSPRQGQICCFCRECGRLVYNVPRAELGLKPQPMREDGISPTVRYRVMERAGFRCEFCGADGSTRRMDIEHLLTQKDIRESGLPLATVNDFDNLAFLCEPCNAGKGAKSLTIHEYLVFQWKRKLQ